MPQNKTGSAYGEQIEIPRQNHGRCVVHKLHRGYHHRTKIAGAFSVSHCQGGERRTLARVVQGSEQQEQQHGGTSRVPIVGEHMPSWVKPLGLCSGIHDRVPEALAVNPAEEKPEGSASCSFAGESNLRNRPID